MFSKSISLKAILHQTVDIVHWKCTFFFQISYKLCYTEFSKIFFTGT
nr:MAG TPA: hypothetical protein [Caudoviricetes sp.]